MTNRFALAAFGLAAVLAVSACAETRPAAPVPELGFVHLEPMTFNVATVDKSSSYASPLKAPHVEHRFPTPPGRAATQWADQRLRAVGNGAVARFVVLEASVVEVPVEKQLTGIRAIFTSEVSVDYQARLHVRLTIEDAHGRPGGSVEVVATRNQTLLENASLADREKAWFDMTEALMVDFDREMESQIRTQLGRWLLP